MSEDMRIASESPRLSEVSRSTVNDRRSTGQPLSIESELRYKCAANREVGLLLAQWEYDQRLLDQALTTVGYLFPHFSQHDASHSRTILERISALLGRENIISLSATDLWLLLESAYFHDVGMIASHARKAEDVNSEEFARHLVCCAKSEDVELSAASRRIHDNLPRTTPREILEGNFDLLLVYADFVRTKHPRRAALFASDPLEHLSMPSPRTPLIPRRFWYLLGQICRSHGEDHSYAMGLPYEESGLGGESCHPRFVACMLRLGDLLDVDGGRFCSSVNAMAPYMPATSVVHERKHDGVCHLLVSPRRISVEATYTDVDAYLEAERWFSWLREELRNQLISWDRIAPSLDFGALPSIGKIQARLEGQIVLASNARPRFEVERDKMLDLVRGANLYSGPHDTVREVIQNAIDATLLRFSYERQCERFSRPESIVELKESLKTLPIRVSIEKANTSPQDITKVRWRLKVHDNGIGMKQADIRYLLRLGSSSRNPERLELVEWLPDWARPSGTFGIGFHSLFEYCRKVELTSRHPSDNDGFKISFDVRHEGQEPTVVVKKQVQTSPYPLPAGTIVEAEFEFPQVPTRISWSGATERETDQLLREYDFVSDSELPYWPAKMRDVVSDLASASLCKIDLNGSSVKFPKDEVEPFDSTPTVDIRLLDAGFQSGVVHLRFRGAIVENNVFWPLLSLDCNLQTGNARNLLDLSRSKLTRQGNTFAQKEIKVAVHSLLPKWLEHFRKDKQTGKISFLALYALLYTNLVQKDQEWREIELVPNSVKLGELADAKELEIHFVRRAIEREKQLPVGVEKGENRLELQNLDLNFRDTDWFGRFIRKHFPGRILRGEKGEPDRRYYVFTQESSIEDIDDDALRAVLVRSHGGGLGCRKIIPCSKKFRGLMIPEGTQGWFGPSDPFMSSAMANPFVVTETAVTLRNLNSYVRWLAERRAEPETTVASTLISFLEHADNLVQDWNVRKEYDISSVVALLKNEFGGIRAAKD